MDGNYIKNSEELRKFRLKNMPAYCPITGVELTEDNSVVDHCHKTGIIRGVISSEGNVLLGKFENSFGRMSSKSRELGVINTLRGIALYYAESFKGKRVLHPVGFRQLYKRFARMKKIDQIQMLKTFDIDHCTIFDCKNSKERTNLYKKLLKN